MLTLSGAMCLKAKNNMLNAEEFEKICRLAKISIDKDHEAEFWKKLDGVFEWITQLSSIDVSNVSLKPTAEDEIVLGEDDNISLNNTVGDILSNTKHAQLNMFSVPKVIE